jgi:GAF domain-containing protein
MRRHSRASGKRARSRRRPKSLKSKGRNPRKVASSRSSSDGAETEVVRLGQELHEALEQQTATSEVLQVISSSLGDLQPVFAAMLENAVRICAATFGSIYRWNGEALHLLATLNTPPAFAEVIRRPFRPDPRLPPGRMVASKAVVHVADVRAEPAHIQNPVAVAAATLGGVRTNLSVPLLHKGELIGAFFLNRQEVHPFTDKQIELVKNFAAQAVIAIENARLLNELRQRTTELAEALEQQTATSEVLQVISGSPGDLEPVFAAMLEKAVRICDAKFGNIYRWDGDVLHLVATHNTPPAFAEARRRSPFRPAANDPVGRMIATKTAVHQSDTTGYPKHDPQQVAAIELGGVKTSLSVPMLREGDLIGAFVLSRQEVKPFTEKQIELATSFAAQAVIAIENARLLNELRQSLEQQTATAEALQVVSSSLGDLEPVFAAMLEKAVRICDANFGVLALHEGGNAFRVVAMHNAPPEFVELRRREPAFQAGLLSPLSRVVASKHLLQIADLTEDAAYTTGEPTVVRFADMTGVRTLLLVPMLKDAEAIGIAVIYRTAVRPFTDKQIELVKNFAAQAVIAIENARLLNELRQSLEQQTATAEVLQVVSSSLGDLEPVFAAMLEKAVRICDASFGSLYRWDGAALHLLATHNTPPALAEQRRRSPLRPNPKTAAGRMVATKTIVHVADLKAEPAYIEGRDPAYVAAVELAGSRTVLAVPMLKEDELIGAILISRQEVRPFSDKQIELVKNFAAQAVIAIENARLLNELRQRTSDLTERTADLTEALEQQTATSEVLQVISGSPSDPRPVFEAMLEKALRVCDATFGSIFRYEEDVIHLVATRNTPSAFLEALKQSPPFRATLSTRARATKSVVQVVDLAAEDDYVERRSPMVVAAVELGGTRTLLVVPMLKENEVVGAFVLNRQKVRPFTGKQIAVVTNFAAQAVIAIENARLLNELRQRTTDLTEALEQQTATSDVLQVISSSRGELPPVFDSLLANATRLCEANFGVLVLHENGTFRNVAMHNLPAAFAERRRRDPVFPAGPLSGLGRVAATKQLLHILDYAEDTAYKQHDPAAVALVERAGARTLLMVPMLKDRELIGSISIFRQEVRAFTNKQIALVQNFAAQAVIAIENTRLLNELKERTAQLEMQSQEVVKLNQKLEQRVAEQVGEIERMGRLRRFLPPQVADLIVASGTEKQLESHRREITALFCDLRGFTGFSEASAPEDVMALLREYHAAIGELIIKYSGTLERYAGDGVMVVFNDPVPVEKPALQAVLMALETREAMGVLMTKWRELGHDVGFGIGIAHGYATLGTIGFEGRFDYAAIGTVSNVASRLCDEAKPGQILISPRVFTAVKDAVTVEPVGEFTLKGIGRPLAAYNVLAAVSA